MKNNEKIIGLIIQALRNPSTANSELDKWLSESEEAREMFTRLSSADYVHKSQREVDDMSKDTGIDSLYAKLEISKKQKVKSLRRRAFIACVAVASAVIAISFLVYNVADKNSKPEPNTVVLANTNFVKPTLIMGDKAINLENITENNSLGSVVPNSIIKINSSQISYIHNDNTSENEIENIINTIVVPARYTYTIELSDGTLVTLNGGSKLTYPTVFEGESRQVDLEGEAFFHVTKSGVPFEVVSHNVTVKAYGTQFNVKHIGNCNIQTVLLEGQTSIAIGEEEEIFMTPGTLAETCSTHGNITLEQINTSDYTYWMRGMFKYEDGSILTVLHDLEQWYGINIVNKQEVDANKKVSFIADKNAPLNENLQFIEKLDIVKFINMGGGEYSIDSF